MEIVRVQVRDGSILYGCEIGNQVYRLEGELYGEFSQEEELLDPVRRLAPVVPTAIYAIGLNYRAHAAEMNSPLPEHPVVFMKSNSSVLDPEAAIELPRQCDHDYIQSNQCKSEGH